MVGGSGLYMDAVIYGLDEFPKIDNKVRDNLNEKYKKFGIKYLQKTLKKLDLNYYLQVDKKNPRRLIRALEVCISSNKPYSSYLRRKKRNHLFNIFHIGIKKDRLELYDKINNRVDEMLKKGLLNEVKSLIKFKDLNVLNTIGYKELFLYLENKTTIERSVEEIKKNSRRFAKRQITWLNSKENIFWVDDKTNIEEIKNIL